MASSRSNPRRGLLNHGAPLADLHPLSTQTVRRDVTQFDPTLKKSSTFHSPTTPPSEDDDPVVNILRLPRRSPTDPRALEDVVAAREQRITSILGSVDRSLSGLEGFADEEHQTRPVEELPVPRFVLDHDPSDPDRMEIDTPARVTENLPARRKHHSSDSGIGSTITERMNRPAKGCEGKHGASADPTETSSALNGSTAPLTDAVDPTRHALSEYACRQIQKHIIAPIVQEASLKAFHPLVTGIPYRVNRKEITCLRDLEKVLLWLAPKWAATKRSYLHFCETSIQCIHTTVEYLSESDQRRPTDRPYTNGYFVDLTEQIRQYAAMISAARARRAAGRSTAEDDAMDHEKVRLRGGYSQTGRPAELVRVREGQTVSLRTGQVIESSGSPHTSPNLGTDEYSDDDVLRSMARRKKNAPVDKTVQRCGACTKTFKRPCDLTKHEKTHSRPWKCSESSCKYHTDGWPTEKERDRHINDKHSATPSMFKCQYAPCPYESKRESNCKQHMEKAHGWAYVRSKNNGKTKRTPHHPSPPTPQLSTPRRPTPASYFPSPSPVGPPAEPSYEPLAGYGSAASRAGSSSASDVLGPPLPPSVFGAGGYGPVDTDMAWDESFSPHLSAHPSSSDDFTHWEGPSMIIPPTAAPLMERTPFQDELPRPLFEENLDWSNMNLEDDFTTNPFNVDTTYNVQLVTPATSVDHYPLDMFHPGGTAGVEHPDAVHPTKLSPGGQGHVTLLSPSYSSHDALHDEGYDEFTTEAGKPTHDFALYGNGADPHAGSQKLFHELSPFMPVAWNGVAPLIEMEQ